MVNMKDTKPRSLFQKIKHLAFKKRTIAVVVVIVIIAVIFFARRGAGQAQYNLEAAQYTALTEHVSETGSINASGVALLYSTTTGIVDEVFVMNGSQVEEGDALFSVKSTATQQEKQSAYASYLAAKNALESAKATQLTLQAGMLGKWDSFKELAESDEYEEGDGRPKYDQRNLPEFQVPEREWLAAEAAYKNQQQVVQEKSVAVSAAWQAYQSTQDSTVRAVSDGEIHNLGVTKGEPVVAPTAAQLASTKPALVLVDTSVPTIVEIQVNETDILKIKEGQEAVVELDALDNQQFTGVVERVDSVASINQDIVQFSVYVRLQDPIETILPGMTADVDIITAKKEKVLTVPSSAVKPYQGGRAVRVVNEMNELEFVPVEIGARGDGRIEITSGLSEGTEVVVSLANEQVERSAGFF